jgi:hypothetical protein
LILNSTAMAILGMGFPHEQNVARGFAAMRSPQA